LISFLLPGKGCLEGRPSDLGLKFTSLVLRRPALIREGFDQRNNRCSYKHKHYLDIFCIETDKGTHGKREKIATLFSQPGSKRVEPGWVECEERKLPERCPEPLVLWKWQTVGEERQ
jgi:hypothetical protein